MTDAIRETKFGPMLTKKDVDISADDYVSDVEGRPFFTVTIKLPALGGILHYEDALGQDHKETFTAAGQIVTGGYPGSSHPIPMFVRKVFADSVITGITVSF